MNKSQKEGRVLDKEMFLFCSKARSVKYFGVIFNLRVNEVFFLNLALFLFFFQWGSEEPREGGEGSKQAASDVSIFAISEEWHCWKELVFFYAQ